MAVLAPMPNINVSTAVRGKDRVLAERTETQYEIAIPAQHDVLSQDCCSFRPRHTWWRLQVGGMFRC